ncbi:unnamed protein product, partial [marine sediment metagenome]
QNLRKANWQITATIDNRNQNKEARLIKVYPGRIKHPPLGVAVDIGTTNIAATLVNLDSGRILNQVSGMNRQIACGEDVISRIIYSEHRGG